MSDQLLNQILEKLNKLDDRIGQHEAKQDSQGDHIVQLLKIVGETNAKAEKINENVNNLDDKVEKISENQQTVIQIQQEQQKILERLSFRSISQEADIAELRRIK